MSNPQQRQQQQQQQQQQQIRQMSLQEQRQYWIPVDDVRSYVPQFPEETKQQYEKGIKDLYARFEQLPENDPQRASVINKLTEVSFKIRSGLKAARESAQRANAVQGQPGAGPAPQSIGRPTSSAQKSQANPGATSAQQQRQAQISQMIQKHLAEFPFTIPPDMQPNGDDAKKYLEESKSRYGKALVAMEMTKEKINRIQQLRNVRNSQGNPFNEKENEDAQQQMRNLKAEHDQAKAFSEKFRASQASFKEKADRAIPNGQAGAPTGQASTSQAQQASATSDVGLPANASTTNAAPRKQSQPASTGQDPSLPGSSSTKDANMSSSHSHPLNVNTSNEQPTSQQQSGSPAYAHPQSANPDARQSYSHSAAIEAANQSHEKGAAQAASGNSSAGYAHQQGGNLQPQPNIGSRGETATTKMPIPKTINLPPPKPVSMGPARPTFSGGLSNGANGMMGQPALQTQPHFTLEGEGERVLSKKKLDELVRQVTGGNEELGGEGLTPEVEEAILEAADDFVDQVVVAACRIAKLRNASTLEVRDVQMILERQYNIRIPGYSSDEIRTTKKVIPAPGWTQKMSAIQAAKVSKDKGDL